MNTDKRVEKLREIMQEKQLEFSIIMNFENQYYFSGLKAITYSRPIVLLIDAKQKSLIIPSLEENHAKEKSNADHLHVYHETFVEGAKTLHTEHLKSLVSHYEPGVQVGVEFSSLPLQLGNILREAGFELVNLDKEIAELRYIKDQEEIDLITESGRLVSMALGESLKHAKSGVTEIEMDQYGNEVLFKEIAKNHPNATVDFFVMSPSGLSRSIMPHVFSNTRKLEENDNVIHSRQVGLNGYRAECERTFFVGEPTTEQKDAFKLAYEAQQAALNIIKVGVTAKEVNQAALNVFKKAGVEKYSIHRTGHGIGIGLHEEPSLRYDNDLTLQEGMVFCVEPAIYISGVGGFRHSDTVVLTDNGTTLITEYPRELEKLIF